MKKHYSHSTNNGFARVNGAAAPHPSPYAYACLQFMMKSRQLVLRPETPAAAITFLQKSDR